MPLRPQYSNTSSPSLSSCPAAAIPPSSARSAQAAPPDSKGGGAGAEFAAAGSGDTVRLALAEPARLATNATLLKPNAA